MMLSQSLAKTTGVKVLGALISPITAVLVIGGVILWRQNKQRAQVLEKIDQHKTKASPIIPQKKQQRSGSGIFEQIIDDNILLRGVAT